MECVDVEGEDAKGNAIIKVLPDTGVSKMSVVCGNAVSAARQQGLAYGSRKGICLIEWPFRLTGRSIRGRNGHMNAAWCLKRQVGFVEECMHATDDAKANCGERNVGNSSSLIAVE